MRGYIQQGAVSTALLGASPLGALQASCQLTCDTFRCNGLSSGFSASGGPLLAR